ERVGGWGLTCCRARRVAPRHDDVHIELDEIRRQLGEPLGNPLGIAIFDEDVRAGSPAEFAQSALEWFSLNRWRFARASGTEHADPRHLPRRLCLRRERSKKAEHQNDREPDPPHAHLGWLAGGSLADDG